MDSDHLHFTSSNVTHSYKYRAHLYRLGIVTFASLSKLANRSLSMFTKSLADSLVPRVVKPQMSANNMLKLKITSYNQKTMDTL